MTHPSRLPPLSEAQLEIMNVVWRRKAASVGDVRDALSAARSVSRTTVQTMLTRLEEKGWLTHRDARGTFLYSATVSRRHAMRHLVRRLVDTAFTGSPEDFVMAMLDGRELTADEAARIQEMIDQAKKGKK